MILFRLTLLFRSFFSPILYWIFRLTIYRGKLPNIWVEVREYSMEQFDSFINTFPYRYDFWFADFTLREHDFFFVEREHNRDCDDWAQMWYWWAEHNSYKPYLVAVCNGAVWKLGHKICVFEKDGEYFLADYHIRGKFSSLEEAVNSLRGNGYPDLLWVITKG